MSNDVVNLHFGFPIGATGATGASGSDGQDGTDNMNVSLKYRKEAELAVHFILDCCPLH